MSATPSIERADSDNDKSRRIEDERERGDTRHCRLPSFRCHRAGKLNQQKRRHRSQNESGHRRRARESATAARSGSQCAIKKSARQESQGKTEAVSAKTGRNLYERAQPREQR